MTVQSLINAAELLLGGIFLCLYLHTLQRSQVVKLLQAWLKYLRGKKRRQVRPNTPQECPLCSAPSTPVNQPNSAVQIKAWAEQKAVQGRKKRVSSAGYDSLTKLLVSVQKARLHPNCRPVFTSDGLNLYFYAITGHFGQWVNVVGKRLPVWQVASSLLYGQLRKVHTYGKVKFSSTRMLLGTRDAFRATMHSLGLTGTIQTAFVEPTEPDLG